MHGAQLSRVQIYCQCFEMNFTRGCQQKRARRRLFFYLNTTHLCTVTRTASAPVQHSLVSVYNTIAYGSAPRSHPRRYHHMSPAQERARPGETSGREENESRYAQSAALRQRTRSCTVRRRPPNPEHMKRFHRGTPIATKAIPDLKLRSKLKYTERCAGNTHPPLPATPPPSLFREAQDGAARVSEWLLPGDAGSLEAEGMEETSRVKQVQGDCAHYHTIAAHRAAQFAERCHCRRRSCLIHPHRQPRWTF